MKMHAIKVGLLLTMIFNTPVFGNTTMDQNTMETIVKTMVRKEEGSAEGKGGYVSFTYQSVPMLLISDVGHDRMRIIAPISQSSDLNDQQRELMLISNFHLSLDARYAISDGIVYSAYIHPMSSLTEEQIQSAVRQVSNLALSFGTAYTSGELSFGGEENSPEAANDEDIQI